MNKREHRMHLWICHVYGKQSACGKKINYGSLKRANEKAEFLTKQYCRLLEAYPCAFCGGWHIGRALTQDERKKYYQEANGKEYVEEQTHGP